MSPRDALPIARASVRGLLAGAAVAVVAATVLLLALGVRGLKVRSGSMAPAIATGDVVLQREEPASAIRVGQVVTFRDPDGTGRLITHRVRGVRLREGRVEVVTRGDANTGSERWSVPAGGRVGIVVARLPRLGYALAWTQGRAGRLTTLALPLLALAAWALWGIWRPSPRGAT